MVYVLASYVHTVCILAVYMHMVYMHTEYILHTGTYGIKRIAYISTAYMHMANMHLVYMHTVYNIYVLWRACNLTSFSPCLTGPVDYPFASRHKGPGFKSPGGYLCGTGILLLAMSRYIGDPK
jgi:hypothetical protein